MSIALLLCGALMLVIWIVLWRKSKAMLQWPVTQGRVVISELRTEKFGSDKTKDVAYVTYDYSVNGAALNGNRIALGGSGKRGARAAVAYYRPGNSVEVFYDPAKPTSSVLERKLSRNALVLPVVGVFFITMSVVLVSH